MSKSGPVEYWKRRVAQLNSKIEELRAKNDDFAERMSKIILERDNLLAHRNFPKENTLQARIDHLREENQKLREQNQILREQNQKLHAENENRNREIERLGSENDRMGDILDKIEGALKYDPKNNFPCF